MPFSNNQKAKLASAYNDLYQELSSNRLKIVGNYILQETIGEGMYGKVKLGVHRLTGQKVAIKVIDKKHAHQLTRELHHHRRLHHDNIVQLYEIMATESRIWMVLEYCSRGELFDYLCERGSLDELECRRVFGQLCLAVAFAHSQNIVHRDLKLENVLLDEDGNVKLGDFGFTREFEGKKLMETFCGTAAYAAPEVLAGKKYSAQEIDIWSLGIILYMLLCGGLPFDDEDERVIKVKVMKGEYDIPDFVSNEAQELIRCILQQDPSKRPTIRTILSHKWFTLGRDLITARLEKTNKGDYVINPDMLSHSQVNALPLKSPIRTKPAKSRSIRSTRSSICSPPLCDPLKPVPNFIELLCRQTSPVPFTQPVEIALLEKMSLVGLEKSQIRHSVIKHSCDSASGLWYLLLKKAKKELESQQQQKEEEKEETMAPEVSPIEFQDNDEKGNKLQQKRGSRRKDSISVAIEKIMHPKREQSASSSSSQGTTGPLPKSEDCIKGGPSETSFVTLASDPDKSSPEIPSNASLVRRKSNLFSALMAWMEPGPRRKNQPQETRLVRRKSSRGVLPPATANSVSQHVNGSEKNKQLAIQANDFTKLNPKRLSDTTTASAVSSKPTSMRSLKRSQTCHSKSSSTSSIGSIGHQKSILTVSQSSSIRVRRIKSKRPNISTDEGVVFIADKKRPLFAAPFGGARRPHKGSWGRADGLKNTSFVDRSNKHALNDLTFDGFGQSLRTTSAESTGARASVQMSRSQMHNVIEEDEEDRDENTVDAE